LETFIEDIAKTTRREVLEGEMSRIVNAGIVFYNIPHYQIEEVEALVGKVRGAMNIGLERLLEEEEFSLDHIYQTLSLTGIYQLGLYELSEIRSLACKVTEELAVKSKADEPSLCALACLKQLLPVLPEFLASRFTGDSPSCSSTKLDTRETPLEKLMQVRESTRFLQTTFWSK
jgi:hypothetical protein